MVLDIFTIIKKITTNTIQTITTIITIIITEINNLVSGKGKLSRTVIPE